MKNFFNSKAPTQSASIVIEIENLTAEGKQIQSDLRHHAEQLTAAQRTADTMTTQARQGQADPHRLAAALAAVGQIEAKVNGLTTRQQEVQAEHDKLLQSRYTTERKEAKDAYLAAVQQYGEACKPVVGLAVKVRSLAQAAGVSIGPDDHLLGRELHIGGAVINI